MSIKPNAMQEAATRRAQIREAVLEWYLAGKGPLNRDAIALLVPHIKRSTLERDLDESPRCGLDGERRGLAERWAKQNTYYTPSDATLTNEIRRLRQANADARAALGTFVRRVENLIRLDVRAGAISSPANDAGIADEIIARDADIVRAKEVLSDRMPAT